MMEVAQNKRKIEWVGFLYLLPAFVFLIYYIYYGIGFNFINSFYDWNGVSAEKLFIGLKNYKELFTSYKFMGSLENTFVFMIVTQVIQISFGFIIAYSLRFIKIGNKFAKSVFFLPYIMSLVVIGVVFNGMFNLHNGFINEVLRTIGLENFVVDWMGNPKVALISVIIANVFTYTGFDVIMYQAGLGGIPKEIVEAADIDGAGALTKIFRIFIPMLNSVHFSLIILGVIGSLKTFEIVWFITQGGPVGSSELVSTFLYKTYVLEYKAGLSSAISMIVIGISLIITVIQLQIKKRLTEG